MLTIARMKSLIYPTFTTLAPTISKKTTAFSLFSLPSCRQSIISNFNPPHNLLYFSSHVVLHPTPILSSFNSFSVSSTPPNQAPNFVTEEADQSSPSGDIHVIVGPMFAGKTTTLLRRITAQSSNGRYSQAKVPKDLLHLDGTLKGLCYSGRLAAAIGILCRTGVQVDSQTYSLLLQECIFRKDFKKGRRIHSQMVIVGFAPNEYLKTKLLILYAKAGDLGTAHLLFDNLLTKSLISWNAMIAGYVQKGVEKVGLSLYYKMRQCAIIPDQYTFASVFRACATLAILEQGKQVHSVLIKSHIIVNVVVNSALIDMYFKCSCLSDGHLVFNKSLDRNVITWTSLISGYGQNGRVLEVLKSFDRMISEGFRPNCVTFLAVLSACSHGGLVEEGWEYFSSMMRDYGIQPQGKHYAAIVDLLGRAGRLQEAYEFVRNSPCGAHPVIWGALLGASRIHGNVDMVKLAGKNFFELELENAEKYVGLSNAYAAFGLWDNVAEIRIAMKELGVKKDPGYSMIEVQREVNYFLMADSSHKQIADLLGIWNVQGLNFNHGAVKRNIIYPLVDAAHWDCHLTGIRGMLWGKPVDEEIVLSVAVIKSNKDTRYGLDSIVTHDGEKLPCWALPNLSSFRLSIGPDAYDKLEVIGIDEAQFFEDLYDFCSKAADHDGKTVIVAGLDGDYLRRRFGSVLDIIPIADSVTKLTARCEVCGKRASFTLRKTEETKTEVIAGADVYMPVCRKHYVSGQVVKVAAKTVLESKKLQCGSFL
ncbi:hypothetical protein LguiB_005255 [Lonicera macranthoides]